MTDRVVVAQDLPCFVVGGPSLAAMDPLNELALCRSLAGLTGLEVETLYKIGWTVTGSRRWRLRMGEGSGHGEAGGCRRP